MDCEAGRKSALKNLLSSLKIQGTTSLCTIAAVISQPLGGYLSDRLGMRRQLIIIPSVVLSAISVIAVCIASFR
jgi:MFS family permease